MPVIDIASVGAITPIEIDTAPRDPRRRRSRADAGEAGRPGCGIAAWEVAVRSMAARRLPDTDERIRYKTPVEARHHRRRVLITGAAGGIGLATARRVLDEGGRVALVAVDEQALAGAAADLGADAVAGVAGGAGESAGSRAPDAAGRAAG